MQELLLFFFKPSIPSRIILIRLKIVNFGEDSIVDVELIEAPKKLNDTY